MSSLEFNGQQVAPELSKKLFEHYPKLEMQLDVLTRVTHEMECLVERTNAIFDVPESRVAGAIERAKEVAVSTSIPVSVQPQLETPPATEVPLTEVEGAVPSDQSVLPDFVPEQGRGMSTATGQLLHKIWRRV